MVEAKKLDPLDALYAPGLSFEDRWDLQTALHYLDRALCGDWEDERLTDDYVCLWLDDAERRLEKRRAVKA